MDTEYRETCHFSLASKNSSVLWNKLQLLKKHWNNTNLAKVGKFKQFFILHSEQGVCMVENSHTLTRKHHFVPEELIICSSSNVSQNNSHKG